MNLWRSLGGMAEVSLTSADPAGALSAINAAGIPVFGADRSDEDIVSRFWIRRQDYRRLYRLCDARGYELKLIKRRGIYWTVRRLLRRPVLLAGALIFLLAAVYLPGRVFFFRVEGNVTVPARLILEKCGQCGISFGASRREVRSERMKNALLEAIPELQWAGINTSGCTATISVRERTDTQPPAQARGVSSIVAARDGVITQCTVTRGNALCRVGQAVKAGDMLVSGYTDCGISIVATRAEGEIYARTERTLRVVTPSVWHQKGEITGQEKKYALILGKKRINFYQGSGISDTGCDKMYTETYLTLPGGFVLPVALVTETWVSRSEAEAGIPEQPEALSEFARAYLSGHMIAGQILRQEEATAAEDGLYCQYGKYACIEMIGQTRSEEIIKPYE